MGPTMTTARSKPLRRYCLCGGTIVVSSTPPSLAVDIAGTWDELHDGAGHGAATPQQAAIARRRNEEKQT
jgi:hypothetical protein